jgi:ATP-dependent RNA helicase DeaD
MSPELPAPIAPPPLVSPAPERAPAPVATTAGADDEAGAPSRPRKPERKQRVEVEGPTLPPEPPRLRRVPDPVPTLRDGDGAPAEGREERSEGSNPDAAELFVNVGRKDGAKASDFYAVLEKQSGITIDDTDYVNVRQRHTFIGLRRELVQKALDALNGATIAGREASAEPSRSRP